MQADGIHCNFYTLRGDNTAFHHHITSTSTTTTTTTRSHQTLRLDASKDNPLQLSRSQQGKSSQWQP